MRLLQCGYLFIAIFLNLRVTTLYDINFATNSDNLILFGFLSQYFGIHLEFNLKS